jgi:hypothetical protein
MSSVITRRHSDGTQHQVIPADINLNKLAPPTGENNFNDVAAPALLQQATGVRHLRQRHQTCRAEKIARKRNEYRTIGLGSVFLQCAV